MTMMLRPLKSSTPLEINKWCMTGCMIYILPLRRIYTTFPDKQQSKNLKY